VRRRTAARGRCRHLHSDELAVLDRRRRRPADEVDLPGKVGLTLDLSAISSGIYGAILVVVVLFRPQGLVPTARRAAGNTAT
jgi:ABC-type branched-subunit amino acid transport system permease subunit